MSFLLAYGAERVAQRWNKGNRRPRDREASLHGSHSHGDPSPSPSSQQEDHPVENMENLCHGLRENKLRTLSIGWMASDFIRSDKSVGVLEKAWQRNRSVTSVSVGLKIGQLQHYQVSAETLPDGRPGIPGHARNRRLLCLTLDRLLAQKSPHYLLSLRLVLDEWIPEHLLHAILTRHVHLQEIEFHGVTCRSVTVTKGGDPSNLGQDSTRSSDTTRTSDRTATNSSICSSTASENLSSVRSEYAAAPAVKRLLHKKKRRNTVANVGSLPKREETHKRTEKVDIISVVMPHLVRIHSPLQTLKLIDCGLVDEDLGFLVNAIHGKQLGTLSVRSNRRLTGHGVMGLCTTPAIRGALDLSLCDLTRYDAPYIARALAARQVPLRMLHLNGNYQLDSYGLRQLVQTTVLQKVQALDLSYCELGESRTTRTLQQLVVSHQSGPTVLREVRLQGCTVTSRASRRALLELLTCPHSRIRRLLLNDAVESGLQWNTDGLEEIAAIMPHNYDLEELAIDYMGTQPNAAVWARIQPWLEWNQLGRRVVVPGRNVAASEWIESIHRAAEKDLDTLYYFIRQSTERFGL